MGVLEFAVGFAIVVVILWDAFETIVLPRTVQHHVRFSRAVFIITWVPLVAALRRTVLRRFREPILGVYGPMFMLVLVIVWAACLIFGFGMMLQALSRVGSDHPNGIEHWREALYLSGSTFFTLGLGDVTPPNGATRALAVIEAGAGFGFLAMMIGYLPIFYQAFARREVSISLLDSRAGSPPTAVELIRRNPERIGGILADSEQWTAELLESHISHPALALFRSQHDRQSWLAALTVILDASSLLMTGLEGLPKQQAQFSYAIARHALVDLAQVFVASPSFGGEGRLTPLEFQGLARSLAGYGFAFVDEGAQTTLASLRAAYEPIAEALGARLLLDLPPWTPSSDASDVWQTSPWDSLPPM
jgi:hypothetical protein